MIIFEGASSLSKFRHKRLLQKLQNQVPKIENLSANFVHFARYDEELTKYEFSVLEEILKYGEASEIKKAGHLFLVVPRFCLQQLTSKRHHIDIMCVDPPSN